jgi:hypothetical protein
VLEMSERVLGDEHPDMITRKANLAYTMQALGQDALALRIMGQSAETSLRVLDITHPDSIDHNQTLDWAGIQYKGILQVLKIGRKR